MEPVYTCQQVQDQTDQMTQGQLGAIREQMPFIMHLSGCPTCRRYLQRAVDLGCILDQWDVPEPRRDILASVMANVSCIQQRQGIGRYFRSFIRWQVRVPAVAAVFVLGMLIAAMWFHVWSYTGWQSQRPGTKVDMVSRNVPLVAKDESVLSESKPFAIESQALLPGLIIVILGDPLALSSQVLSGPVNNKTQGPL